MTRMTRKLFCGLMLSLVFALPANVAAQSNITYVYDESGRLVGVIDAAGNAAAYKYDAVGNLLSITRYTSSDLSIIGFTPTSGPVGASVTILGTGFSATPTQNTVTFNGVAATVTSATVNQIVTTVPTGATTGPITISLTNPDRSVTSSRPFTVTAAGGGAPTITGFTPGIGLPGTSLTINGTNFDTNIANDKTRLNATLVAPTSATGTSIVMSVPSNTTSGHISVATPAGKAVSSADFYVVPPGYQTTQVGFTGRITLPGTGTVPVNASNQFGLMLFDGVVGQRVSLVTSGTPTGGCGGGAGQFNVSILNPDGSTLAPVQGFCGVAFFDVKTLPATATYTILVTSSGVTGSVGLTLYNVPPDIRAGPITPTPG